jgi:uncharacterized SAM-binding protein YcdF (DUF218 family)
MPESTKSGATKTPIAPTEPEAPTATTAPTEIAVVLGSGLTADGQATEVTALRAKAAAALLAEKPMKLILSGSRSLDDNGRHGRTEAEVMAEIVKAYGVNEDSLLFEDQSLDTLGNAIFSADRHLRKLEPGTLYVVTSPFHMERSLYIFQQVLGASWTVVACQSPEWSGETRKAGAQKALERAKQFFADLAPGDIDACLAKLKKSYGERAA